MRGMFTCGVTDVLMEYGVTFDGAAGISAGAVFGCNYKSRQAGRAIRYNKRFCADPRYCGVRSLLLTGDLFGVDFCYREIPDVLDPFDRAAFRDDPMRFFVGATDLEEGTCVYHECTDGGEEDMLWLRASASMPLVSRPVRVDGRAMLDGGLTDAVPYAFREQRGYRRNVIVLTQPAGYRKAPAGGMLIMKCLLGKYPKAVRAMARRHEMYNREMDEIDRREVSGEALVIRPPRALGIGHTEKRPEELERVYQVGVAEARRRVDEIRAFLAGGE